MISNSHIKLLQLYEYFREKQSTNVTRKRTKQQNKHIDSILYLKKIIKNNHKKGDIPATRKLINDMDGETH